MFGLSLGAWLRAGAVLAVVGLLTFTHWNAYQRGRMAERAATFNDISQENNDAGNAAEDARDALRRCRERGGVFDFATRTCEP